MTYSIKNLTTRKIVNPYGMNPDNFSFVKKENAIHITYKMFTSQQISNLNLKPKLPFDLLNVGNKSFYDYINFFEQSNK